MGASRGARSAFARGVGKTVALAGGIAAVLGAIFLPRLFGRSESAPLPHANAASLAGSIAGLGSAVDGGSSLPRRSVAGRLSGSDGRVGAVGRRRRPRQSGASRGSSTIRIVVMVDFRSQHHPLLSALCGDAGVARRRATTRPRRSETCTLSIASARRHLRRSPSISRRGASSHTNSHHRLPRCGRRATSRSRWSRQARGEEAQARGRARARAQGRSRRRRPARVVHRRGPRADRRPAGHARRRSRRPRRAVGHSTGRAPAHRGHARPGGWRVRPLGLARGRGVFPGLAQRAVGARLSLGGDEDDDATRRERQASGGAKRHAAGTTQRVGSRITAGGARPFRWRGSPRASIPTGCTRCFTW